MASLRTAKGADIVSVLKTEFAQIEECTVTGYGLKKISTIYNTVACFESDQNEHDLQRIIAQLKSACVAKMKELLKESNGNSTYRTKFFALTRDPAFMDLSEKVKHN